MPQLDDPQFICAECFAKEVQQLTSNDIIEVMAPTPAQIAEITRYARRSLN